MRACADFDYTIFSEEELIIERYQGEYTLSDLMQLKYTISQHTDYNPKYKVLHDLRNVKILANVNQVESYAQFLAENIQLQGARTSILYTADPDQVVFGTLVGLALSRNGVPIDIELCSSVDYIAQLTNIPIQQLQEMLAIDESFKKEPLYSYN